MKKSSKEMTLSSKEMKKSSKEMEKSSKEINLKKKSDKPKVQFNIDSPILVRCVDCKELKKIFQEINENSTMCNECLYN
jgi:hypothetical protein